MPDRSTSRPSRRRYLRRVAVAVGAGVAGCSGLADDPTGGGSNAGGTPAGTDDSSGTDGGTGSVPTDVGTAVFPGYETTEVRATEPDGTLLGSVTAAVADTTALQYRGLSDTESLPEDHGMLFVFGSTDDRTFVMRGMAFGIDIVYADGEGVITRIHHAPAPGPGEDGNDQRYPGRGRYVLEVNYGWTTDRGVEVGDVLEFER